MLPSANHRETTFRTITLVPKTCGLGKKALTKRLISPIMTKAVMLAGEHCGHCKARGACKAYLLYKLNGGTEDESQAD